MRRLDGMLLAAARVEALGMAAGRCRRLRSDLGSFCGEAGHPPGNRTRGHLH
jgi:hypothetical protein